MSSVQKMDLRGGSTEGTKSYYVNFCVKRVHTEDTEDQQVIIDVPSAYIPSSDAGLAYMRAAVADRLTFFTDNGGGVTIKSFSRMDL